MQQPFAVVLRDGKKWKLITNAGTRDELKNIADNLRKEKAKFIYVDAKKVIKKRLYYIAIPKEESDRIDKELPFSKIDP